MNHRSWDSTTVLLRGAAIIAWKKLVRGTRVMHCLEDSLRFTRCAQRALNNMDILAQPILVKPMLSQYWLNLGVGFMLEADKGPLLAQNWPTGESGPTLGP